VFCAGSSSGGQKGTHYQVDVVKCWDGNF